MSDRAAVMKNVDAEFRQFMQSEVGKDTAVHFVHCNAHFWLGLSHSCETGFKEVEKTVTENYAKLGSDQHAKFGGFINSTENTIDR